MHAIVQAQLARGEQSKDRDAVALMLLGTLLMLAGIGLIIGNRTGLFPTFPYAGFIVSGIGGVLFAAGQRADSQATSSVTPNATEHMALTELSAEQNSSAIPPDAGPHDAAPFSEAIQDLSKEKKDDVARPSSHQSFDYDQLIDGRYSLTRRIGVGGYGEVWLGNDISDKIPKAIKIFSSWIEPEVAKSQCRAHEIITKLNHPYIVRTDRFFMERGRLIVIMERADSSLRDRLKQVLKEGERGLPVESLLKYMRHAAEALDYLHEEGVVHRNITPQTILLVGGSAKLAGFDILLPVVNLSSTKTTFAGSSSYSAPETWKGQVCVKSDQYSLAITYAELRLGRNLIAWNTIYEAMIAHLQSWPDLNPIPEAEQQVLLQAMAKEPGDRFTTCREFIEALDAAIVRPEMFRKGDQQFE